MKKIAILLLLLFSLESMAQTYQENLEKYWYYRQRLKEKFMDISGGAAVKGNYIPAECRSDLTIKSSNSNNNLYDEHYIRWGDATWLLGHYITVLSFEYSLLKQNGQDYSATLLELNLVLNTYDRLDDGAETCYQGNPEWNGFFLRDDVSDENADAFPKSNGDGNLFLESDYKGNCLQDKDGGVISQDQVISLLMGLRMAKVLVDDDWIQQKIVWITSTIVGRMHEYVWPFKYWRIRNPVTNEIVPIGGSLANLYPFCRAIAESANGILMPDLNAHYGYSSSMTAQAAFNIVQDNIMLNYQGVTINFPPVFIGGVLYSDFSLDGSPFNAYLTALLSLQSHNPPNIYDWLTNLHINTSGYFGMPNNVGLYPHLPLLAEVLYGYNGNSRMPQTIIESDFLDPAPPCGSYHIKYNDENGNAVDIVTSPPWHTMGLFHPQHNFGDWRFDGEYNMIDYMLLYNAYFYLYHSTEGLIPYVFHEEPITFDTDIYAARQIDAKCNIYQSSYVNVNVNFSAGQSIILKPGFSVSQSLINSCTVNLQINPELNDEVYYYKTNANPCNSREFIPQHITINKEKNSNHIHGSKSSIDTNFLIDSYYSTEINKEPLIGFESVYPNPSSSNFTFVSMSIIQSISVHNSFGDLILSKNSINKNTVTFDLFNSTKGIYYLKVVSTKGGVNIHKIIKL